MKTKLMINHIVVGKIYNDDMSGISFPKLKTFIQGDNFIVNMIYYHFDFIKESFKAVYVLLDYSGDGSNEDTLYEFDSEKQVIDDWEEFYQLKEIDEFINQNTKEDLL